MKYLKSASKFLRHVSNIGVVNFILEWNLLTKTEKCTDCGGVLNLTTNGRGRDVIHRCGANECQKKRARRETFFNITNVNFLRT